MKQKLIQFALAFAILTLAFEGCKDPNKPGKNNEEEVITKVQLNFVEVGNASNTFAAIFSDPDGDGGSPAVRFDTILLDAGKVYELNIAIFDESNPSQVKDISAEVKAEGNEHLFCFTPAGASVSIVITDSDGNFPLGLRSQWTAGGPSSGSVQIKLKHQPDGQKNGTCAPGATDLQLDFVAVVR